VSVLSFIATAPPSRRRGEAVRADVSVIMPAYEAFTTIARAAHSALHGEGIAVELGLCADDGRGYAALLRPVLPSRARLTVCRTALRAGARAQCRACPRQRGDHRLPRCGRCLCARPPARAPATLRAARGGDRSDPRDRWGSRGRAHRPPARARKAAEHRGHLL